MTDAVKRHLLGAEKNLGGKFVVGCYYGLRSINTGIAMDRLGLAERHPQFGRILTAKGEAARAKLQRGQP